MDRLTFKDLRIGERFIMFPKIDEDAEVARYLLIKVFFDDGSGCRRMPHNAIRITDGLDCVIEDAKEVLKIE